MPTLFDALRIGSLTAPNRIFMAPLTRGRATRDHVPTERMVRYYAQRASAGLIMTEATGISRQGLGWPYAPGLWTDEQCEAWKPVTAAVHAAGGRIFAQLWHMGRVVHPDYLGGGSPVSASATTAPFKAHTYDGRKPYAQARALDASELPGIVKDYVRAATNAMAAGFDGVQLHSANGYLLDQFLRDGSNQRTDSYGGSIENRVRLLREVAEAVAGVVGAERMGVRFSPNGESQGVDDRHPEELFPAAAKMLDAMGIAFLELREPGPDGTFGKTDVPKVSPRIREVFTRPLVLNSDYTKETADAAIASGLADAITFGRPFIANPVLPARLAKGAALAKDDMATWYTQGDEGYVDYRAEA
jgi:N-ethylmaleimide reductase